MTSQLGHCVKNHYFKENRLKIRFSLVNADIIELNASYLDKYGLELKSVECVSKALLTCARIKDISSDENCCSRDINHHAAPRWFVMVWWNVESHKYASDSRIILISACVRLPLLAAQSFGKRGRRLSQPKSSSLTTTPPICSTWLSRRQTSLLFMDGKRPPD